MEETTSNFTARAYQIDLFEKAVEQNTIVYLPTGAGKTFIGVMLIKKLSADLQRPFTAGGKRTIFAVNTVALVMQQCNYIQRHTGLTCRGYSGDSGVDYWSKEDWLQQLEQYQVMVMTAQIFLDILIHGYLKLNQVNLIIFDECHRAVKNQPMRQIMKLFQHCLPHEQPRVLALSATLLNSNVEENHVENTIVALETTFQSRIATVDSKAQVQSYSTNPSESIIKYDTFKPPEVVERKVFEILETAHEILRKISLTNDLLINESSHEFQGKSKNDKLRGILDDIKEHFYQTGLYGVSKSVLLHLKQFESFKKTNDDSNAGFIFEYLITRLTLLRKLLDIEMKSCTEAEKIHKFSSDHVQKLFAVLKNFNEHRMSDQDFCTIVFVQRRFTAKVLYHVLKNLRNDDERYSFIKPDYVIGFSNNPYKNSKETLCIAKWNKEALLRFKNGQTNCLIATDMIDEGIDIPTCTLIVRYDLPMDFRAYVQSKGRARHATSQYVLMVNSDDLKFVTRYNQYKKIESYLNKILIGKTEERNIPAVEDIVNDLYETKLEPYVVRHNEITSCVTDLSAVPLINRYCTNLYKSKFVQLVPVWKLHKLRNRTTDALMFQVSLKMPSICPVKDTILGQPMGSIDEAKRAAALQMCIMLHKVGELTNHLLPREVHVVPEDFDYLFPHWQKEENKEEARIAGTNRKKRQHQLEYPRALYSAYPVPNEDVYLHIIRIVPAYSVPHDNRNLVFYNILNSKSGYGIVSGKKLPQIPKFPIFMNVGELNVEIKVNYSIMKLTSEQINALRIFHTLVFHNVLDVIKPFMVFDEANLENSFLIAPTNENDEISWDVVQTYQSITQYNTSLNRTSSNPAFEFKPNDYELAVVAPNYRASLSVYIVTQVCDDLTPDSCFPTEDFNSYAHYYYDRHGLSIKDLKQNMLEVKPVSTKIDCIRPRRVKPGLSKRKRADILQDLEEHLVPELCIKIDFPALYWLKATPLPSILHRLSQILVADDLRMKIIEEAQLGKVVLPSNENWPSLKIKDMEIDETIEPLLETTLEENEMIESGQSVMEVHGPEVDVLNSEANLYPWVRIEEPPDLDRNLENIQLIDIECYHRFISEPIDQEYFKTGNKQLKYMSRPQVDVPALKVLQVNMETGPSPVDIMQALTAKLGQDVFNLERLETLGDSFLKYFISLYLYETFPILHEGPLTALKGKLLGNRNLYYCGKQKNIPGRMKVDAFVPASNFITPCYTAPRLLQQILLDVEISPSVLYEISIPLVERLSGKISLDTIDLIQEKVSKWENSEAPTDMEHFVGQQTVPDKVAADCVEALIGVYLTSMGLKAAAKLLTWFQIVPPDSSIHEVLFSIPKNPTVGPGNPDSYMPWAETIEKMLGYKFRNRAFLLQAFTHPSYTPNTITECYQRLEFLGDAIIDFLITVYIFENCGDLDPGALTDLRSALVNNITFACLSVRHGLHTALLSYSPILNDIIDKFVKFQEDRNYVINDELLWILLEEEECKMAEYVDVPKVLGDIFESLIGAIYLDTDKDISKVWEIVYSLMHNEIDEFSKNVPKQPVRVVYETPGAKPKFMKADRLEDPTAIMVGLEVFIEGSRKLFHGFGANKKQAKCAAAKLALKSLRYKH